MRPRLFWPKARTHNFGDRLTQIMTEHLLGEPARWVNFNHSAPYGMMVGSHTIRARRNTVVMGTGLQLPKHRPSPEATYLFVRGPHTRKAVINQGGECPEIYCDLGLLLAEVFPRTHTGNKLGIIPHWKDKELAWLFSVNDPKVKVIDIEATNERFLSDLWECEYVVSSALHGIVAAHAYSIPAAWGYMSDKLRGGQIKYLDYLHGMGMEVPYPQPVTQAAGAIRASQYAVVPSLDQDMLTNVKELVQSARTLIC